MRELILREIRRLAAKNDGQPPGFKLFKKETGIGESTWRGKFWARWGDALIEAGFEPNEWTGRRDTSELLTGLIETCRHYGRLPTMAEITMYSAKAQNVSLSNKNTILRHFKSRAGMIAALAEFSSQNSGYDDIRAMLPEEHGAEPSEAVASRRNTEEGFVYLIQAGDFYKIGRSDNIERRVKEIRVAMPEKASLIHAIRTDDPAGIEAYWHRRFAEKRANGEWFKLTSVDISAFKKRKFQ